MPSLKILTINIGLLDYKVGGFIAFSNPPFSEYRLPAIPPALLHPLKVANNGNIVDGSCEEIEIEPDIITIQECYNKEHALYIYDSLKHKLPFMSRMDNPNKWGVMNLHNGMLTLSKYPIINEYCRLLSHSHVANVEAWFGDKCTLITAIDVPEYGVLHVLNVHPTAGGADPESTEANLNRTKTLNEIIGAFHQAVTVKGHGAIIVGDFNCGPDASPENFSHILDAGFRDTYTEKESEMKLASPSVPTISCTWDNKNLLNRSGPHAECPPQRVDHILIPRSDVRLGRIIKAEIVFSTPIVQIPTKNKHEKALSTISDHYGVFVEIELQSI